MELNFIRRLLIAVIACTVTFAANAQTYTPETEAEGFVALYEAMLADGTRADVHRSSHYPTDENYQTVTTYQSIPRRSSGITSSPLFPNIYLSGSATAGLNCRLGLPSSVCPTYANSGSRISAGNPRLFVYQSSGDLRTTIETQLAGKVSPDDIASVINQFEVILAYYNTGRPYLAETDIQARLEAARRFPAEQQAERQAEQQRLAAAAETERQRLAALEAERLQVVADRQKLADLETEIAEVKAELESISRELVARAVAGMTQTPSADDGGSSGGGAIAAVAVIGGALYWFKLRNPKATYTFAALPTDTDAYTAQFNYAPHENWNVNFEFTEGNLFVSNDFVKPDTNSTAKMTVKYTW